MTSEDDLTLKMTSSQVVETSVSHLKQSSQDYTHPDDHNLRTYDDSTLCNVLLSESSIFCFVRVGVDGTGLSSCDFGIFTGLEFCATEVERHYHNQIACLENH